MLVRQHVRLAERDEKGTTRKRRKFHLGKEIKVCLWEASRHAVHILKETVFARDFVGAREMVDFLMEGKALKLRLLNVLACPQHIKQVAVCAHL